MSKHARYRRHSGEVEVGRRRPECRFDRRCPGSRGRLAERPTRSKTTLRLTLHKCNYQRISYNLIISEFVCACRSLSRL